MLVLYLFSTKYNYRCLCIYIYAYSFMTHIYPSIILSKYAYKNSLQRPRLYIYIWRNLSTQSIYVGYDSLYFMGYKRHNIRVLAQVVVGRLVQYSKRCTYTHTYTSRRIHELYTLQRRDAVLQSPYTFTSLLQLLLTSSKYTFCCSMRGECQTFKGLDFIVKKN